MHWWTRYLPYAFVLWIARKRLERIAVDESRGLTMTHVYPGEFLGWKERR